MKVLDDCHRYEMDTFLNEGKGMHPGEYHAPFKAFIGFYEMREDGDKIDGVTNEEVLSVLIHRLEALDKKFPCFENEMALSSLKGALSWLNARTEERTKRKVEGTHKP
jgi:hypothetical protein